MSNASCVGSPSPASLVAQDGELLISVARRRARGSPCRFREVSFIPDLSEELKAASAITERYRGRCCKVALATTGCRCYGWLRDVDEDTLTRLGARNGTVRFINQGVFASVNHGEEGREKKKSSANSLKRSCRFLCGILLNNNTRRTPHC